MRHSVFSARSLRAAFCLVAWALIAVAGMGDVSVAVTPDNAAGVDSSAVTTMNSLVGLWEGRYGYGDSTRYATMAIERVLGDRWWSCVIRAWSDSAKSSLLGEQILYVKPGDTTGIFRAHCLTSKGIGQTGQAAYTKGMWRWLWHWDDGTVEVGSMVTSAPGRLTYESRVTDKNGYPLPNVELDLRKVEVAQK